MLLLEPTCPSTCQAPSPLTHAPPSLPITQVAGYTVAYANQLTYATVKGAGHMVPQTNPREALAMFDRFISGQPLYPVKPSSAASATAGAEAVATA